MKAADYGDDPSIRHSYGEHLQTSQQPWEQEYAKRKVAYKGDVWEIIKVKGSKARIQNAQGRKKWVPLEKLVAA